MFFCKLWFEYWFLSEWVGEVKGRLEMGIKEDKDNKNNGKDIMVK